VLALALLAGLLAAPAREAAAQGPAPKGNVLHVGHHVDPTSLHPFGSTTVAFESVFGNVVEKLMLFEDTRATVKPNLARSWRWLNDTTLEIRLVDNVRFSNGEPMDAAAVKFSLEELGKAKPFQAWTKDVFKEIQVADPLTVRVVTPRPAPYLVPLLARGGFVLPPQHHQAVGFDKFALAPVGTGPFVFKEWVKDSHITLERNPGFRRGPHPIERVVFKVIVEDTARTAAIEAGELDLALNVPVSHLKRLQGKGHLAVVTVDGLRKFAAYFDTSFAPLKDPRVRIAMNHAVDKEAIAQSLFLGAATSMPGQWQLAIEPGHNPEIRAYAYDPKRARELLAAAGHPQGLSVTLRYTVGRYPLDKELGEIVASYLEQVGIQVKQVPLEYGEFLRQRAAKQLGPMHQWGLLLTPDPWFNYSLFTKGTIYRFWDYPARWDELIAQAAREPSESKQTEMYNELSRITHADPFAIFLIVPKDIYAANRRVKGFAPRIDQALLLYGATLAP
jgi:peptide/nickel transport system substrate-binding protein